MSRQRFIYPEIWQSEQVLSLSPMARLLFIGIFSTADDYGRSKASAITLKAKIFPADLIANDLVYAWRAEIAAQGLIRLYKDDQDAEILDVPSWSKYQKPKHVSQSRLPEFPGAGEVVANPAPDPGQCGPDMARTPGRSGPAPDETLRDGACGVVLCGEVKSGVARRKTYGASGVPSLSDSDTANGITAPEGVAAEDWWRLLRLTAVWPAAGKGTGIERLAAIMRGGGPDDAERHVRMVDDAWKQGKLRRAGKAGLPWAVLGKNGFDPPDGIAATAEDPGTSREVMALGDILPRPP